MFLEHLVHEFISSLKVADNRLDSSVERVFFDLMFVQFFSKYYL